MKAHCSVAQTAVLGSQMRFSRRCISRGESDGSEVVGTLIDLDCSEDFIKNLLQSVPRLAASFHPRARGHRQNAEAVQKEERRLLRAN